MTAGCVVASAACGAGTGLVLSRAIARGDAGVPWVAGIGGSLVLALAGFATLAAMRALSRSHGRTRASELVLSLVASLPPEDPANWQPGRFRERPALAAFLEAIGSDLSRMRARLGRRLGMEGELARLEKALEDSANAVKTDGFEDASVGRLADLCGRLQEKAAEAERRAEALGERQRRVGAGADEAAPLLQESLRWNGAVLDRLSVQEVELKRLGEEARELGRRLAAGPVAAGADPAADLLEIQQELAGLGAVDESQDLVRAVRRIDRVAERGSRLALRAAAEVSRQGAATDSLLPLVQELQDMVADVRAAGSLLEDAAAPAGGGPKLEAIGRRLEQVLAVVRNQGRLGQGSARGSESAEAIAAGLREAVCMLSELPAGFNQQSERLEEAARVVAIAAGREPRVQSDLPASEDSAEPMQLERFNPFGGAAPRPGPLGRVAATDATGTGPRGLQPDRPGGARRRSLFDLPARSMTSPAAASSPFGDGVGPESPAVPAAPAARVEPVATGAPVAPADPARPVSPGLRRSCDRESGRAGGEERVHDLSEFGAVALDAGSAEGPRHGAGAVSAADDPEPVHDLSEFDAVALD